MGKLDSQVAIGIGSSRGIGRAVALELAREGANVALNGAHNRALLKRLEREIASSGREALALLADVAQRTEVDEMVQMVVEKWGRIDVLVNNAGILRLARLEKLPERQRNEPLRAHPKGTWPDHRESKRLVANLRIVEIGQRSYLFSLVRRIYAEGFVVGSCRSLCARYRTLQGVLSRHSRFDDQ